MLTAAGSKKFDAYYQSARLVSPSFSLLSLQLSSQTPFPQATVVAVALAAALAVASVEAWAEVWAEAWAAVLAEAAVAASTPAAAGVLA